MCAGARFHRASSVSMAPRASGTIVTDTSPNRVGARRMPQGSPSFNQARQSAGST